MFINWAHTSGQLSREKLSVLYNLQTISIKKLACKKIVEEWCVGGGVKGMEEEWCVGGGVKEMEEEWCVGGGVKGMEEEWCVGGGVNLLKGWRRSDV